MTAPFQVADIIETNPLPQPMTIPSPILPSLTFEKANTAIEEPNHLDILLGLYQKGYVQAMVDGHIIGLGPNFGVKCTPISAPSVV